MSIKKQSPKVRHIRHDHWLNLEKEVIELRAYKARKEEFKERVTLGGIISWLKKKEAIDLNFQLNWKVEDLVKEAEDDYKRLQHKVTKG